MMRDLLYFFKKNQKKIKTFNAVGWIIFIFCMRYLLGEGTFAMFAFGSSRWAKLVLRVF